MKRDRDDGKINDGHHDLIDDDSDGLRITNFASF